MFGVLALLFLVVPIAELAVIVAVSGSVGLGTTLLLLVAVSVLGAWLVKREGVGAVRRVQAQLDRGQLPGRELVDGFLVLFAGVLMLTPGFLTDILGIALLLPPVRAVVRPALVRRLQGRVVRVVPDTRWPGR